MASDFNQEDCDNLSSRFNFSALAEYVRGGYVYALPIADNNARVYHEWVGEVMPKTFYRYSLSINAEGVLQEDAIQNESHSHYASALEVVPYGRGDTSDRGIDVVLFKSLALARAFEKTTKIGHEVFAAVEMSLSSGGGVLLKPVEAQVRR